MIVDSLTRFVSLTLVIYLTKFSLHSFSLTHVISPSAFSDPLYVVLAYLVMSSPCLTHTYIVTCTISFSLSQPLSLCPSHSFSLTPSFSDSPTHSWSISLVLLLSLLPVSQSLRETVCLSFCLSVCLSVCLSLSTSLSLCLFLSPPLSLSR